MDVISNVLSVSACIGSILAMIYAVKAAKAVRELLERQPPLNESRLKSLETSLAEQADALLEVANRVKMQKVRNAASHVTSKPLDAMPDPYTDPDGWRKAMNRKMATAKINGGH